MAYNTSNNYKQIIYSGGSQHKLKIWVNNIDLETLIGKEADRVCEKITRTSRVLSQDGSKRFTLDNFMSQEITLILHDIDPTILQDQIKISIGTLINSNNYEYVPLGIFNIQDTPTTDKNKTTIKLRDNRVKFDVPYNAKPLIDSLGGSATKKQILNDICTKSGVTNDVTTFLGEDDLIGTYDSTVNGNIYVIDIAEQAGLVPIITREGHLDFVNLQNSTIHKIPLNILEKYELGNSFEVKRIVFEDGIRKYQTSSDETLDTLYLNSANPYISSQEQINSIFSALENYKIDSVKTGKIMGDPAIDPWDLIQVYGYYTDLPNGNKQFVADENTIVFETLANQTMTYTGKIISTYDTQIGIEERKENVSLNGDATFRKYAKTSIDNINAEIDLIVEQQDEHTDQISELNINVEGISSRVSKTEDDIQEIVTTTNEIDGDNHIYVDDALESDAIEYVVDGRCEQDSYSGKNLLNYFQKYTSTNWNNFSAVNLTIPEINFEQNKTYYISADVKLNSGTANKLATMRFADIAASLQNVVEINNPNLSNVYQRYCFSITPTQNFVGTLLALQIGAATSASITFKDYMISTSSDYQNFEPYVGGTASPNPDYPQEIKTIPSIVNLFDKDNANVLNCALSNNQLMAGSNFRTLYIKCEPNTTYIIQKNNSGNTNRFAIATTEIEPLLGNTVNQLTNNHNSQILSFTTNSTALYLCVWFWHINETNITYDEMLNSIQIEPGTTPHEYIPYGYWAKVKITGKNLLNISNKIVGYGFDNANNVIVSSSSFDIYYIPVIEGKTYISSVDLGTSSGNIAYAYSQTIPQLNTAIIGRTTTNISILNNGTFTVPSGSKYLLIRITKETQVLSNWQIEQGNQATTYEPYKENQVLIDMSKENLFDKDNANVFDNWFIYGSGTIGYVQGVSSNKLIQIPILGGKTYTCKKDTTSRFRLSTSDKDISEFSQSEQNAVSKTIVNDSANELTITSSYNDKYLYINASTTLAEYETLINSLIIYEGTNSTPYHELCSINDYKDTLTIKDGQVVIDKVTNKVVLDGSESGWNSETASTGYLRYTTSGIFTENIINNNGLNNRFTQRISQAHGEYEYLYMQPNTKAIHIQILPNRLTGSNVNDFKNWLSTHNTDVYYILQTQYQIQLKNANIPLFDGVNHITFVDDLDTNTHLKYYLKTPLSDTYVTHSEMNSEIKQTADGIIANVNAKDAEQDNRISSAEAMLTTQGATLNIISSNINTTTGEVESVRTVRGYTLDDEGLKISTSDDTFNSLSDNTGTYYKDGDTILTQFTKDKSIMRDIVLYGKYYYGVDENIDVANFTKDDAMFIAERYEDSNGEIGFGHFYNQS